MARSASVLRRSQDVTLPPQAVPFHVLYEALRQDQKPVNDYPCGTPPSWANTNYGPPVGYTHHVPNDRYDKSSFAASTHLLPNERRRPFLSQNGSDSASPSDIIQESDLRPPAHKGHRNNPYAPGHCCAAAQRHCSPSQEHRYSPHHMHETNLPPDVGVLDRCEHPTTPGGLNGCTETTDFHQHCGAYGSTRQYEPNKRHDHYSDCFDQGNVQEKNERTIQQRQQRDYNQQCSESTNPPNAFDGDYSNCNRSQGYALPQALDVAPPANDSSSHVAESSPTYPMVHQNVDDPWHGVPYPPNAIGPNDAHQHNKERDTFWERRALHHPLGAAAGSIPAPSQSKKRAPFYGRHPAIPPQTPYQYIVNRTGVVPSYVAVIGHPLVDSAGFLRYILGDQQCSNSAVPLADVQLVAREDVVEAPNGRNTAQESLRDPSFYLPHQVFHMERQIRQTTAPAVVIEGFPATLEESQALDRLLGPPLLLLILTVPEREVFRRLKVLANSCVEDDVTRASREAHVFAKHLPDIVNYFESKAAMKVVDFTREPIVPMSSYVKNLLIRYFLPAGSRSSKLSPNPDFFQPRL